MFYFLFWYTLKPRSGGTTMKQIMEICLNMKLFDSSPTSFSMIPEEVERNETVGYSHDYEVSE